MNPTVKDKLVSALRSGDYKQTKGQLKSGDCFCVLGVLCNIYQEEHPDKAHWDKNNIVAGQLSGYFLPPIIQEWAEVDTNLGDKITIDYTTATFSSHNDGLDFDNGANEEKVKACTFLELADAIEAQC